MNAHAGTALSTGRRKPSELVAEYQDKAAAAPLALSRFEEAQNAVKLAASIGGTWGWRNLDTGRLMQRDIEASLLRSAWRHTYELYDIATFATADDKRRIAQMLEQPPAFTVENIREQFGRYIADPWGSILRGMAEVFSGLDPAYKSHEKVKIGVQGLPKRIILTSCTDYGSYGKDRLQSVLNALAAYQRKPLVSHLEMSALMKCEDALLVASEQPGRRDGETETWPARGVRLRRFQNGNAHLFFEPAELLDINRALAEFYGDVLPDCPEEAPAKRTGTAVSKDLQYYPTPAAVVERVLGDIDVRGKRVLEPSCGCGRFLDAIRAKGGRPYGIEVDGGRAALCRQKGHDVYLGNFLETQPGPEFDLVVMNPPFYGRHYAKHVRHALGFLRPGGRLVAILPSTARYDHGLLDDLKPRWDDLPVGSFSESGTNIGTVVATIWAARGAS